MEGILEPHSELEKGNHNICAMESTDKWKWVELKEVYDKTDPLYSQVLYL